MNPFMIWTVAETAARTTVAKMRRRCPRCGRAQVVATRKARAEVPCQRCGALIRLQAGSKGRR